VVQIGSVNMLFRWSFRIVNGPPFSESGVMRLWCRTQLAEISLVMLAIILSWIMCVGVLRMVVWFVRQSRWLDACGEISLQFVSACVCESRHVRVRRVGACRTIVESGREREFVPPQPLVVWG
jgi:hypothetical protein